MSNPRIKVLCFFYNEEFLLPFFLSHYWWADEIHAVVSKSTDRTEEILRYPRHRPEIRIEPIEFPQGIDDFIKMNKVNEILRRQHLCEWIIVVDSDEFIWPSSFTGRDLDIALDMEGPHKFLSAVPPHHDVLFAKMWNVFRHRNDSDLDANEVPIVLQRRNGDADRSSAGNAQYQKPIVIRANRGVQLGLGNHELASPAKIGDAHFDGAHWQNADPAFCLRRRLRDRRDHMSPTNMVCGLGAQHRTTEEAILAMCKAHENDPQCF